MGVLLCVLVVACVLRLLAGGSVLHWPEAGEFFELRANRLASGLVVGASLGLAGVLLQTLVRNPLASPDLLGLSAGAGLATMLAAWIGWQTGSTLITQSVRTGPAFLGAIAALASVYTLGQKRGVVEPISLILVGVIVGVMCAGASMAISSLLPPEPAGIASRVLFGSLGDDVSWTTIMVLGAIAIGSLVAGVAFAHQFDAMSMGEDEARSVGVSIRSLRLGMFLVAGALTAGTVAIAGTIGFVGLVGPHVVRLVFGPSHRVLIPASAVAGAIIVVGADTGVSVAKMIEPSIGRVPIGVVTALLGGPVFLVLLRTSRVRAWSHD